MRVGDSKTELGLQVMSMYGLLKSNPEPTAQQVEDQLDGNLCRLFNRVLNPCYLVLNFLSNLLNPNLIPF